MKRTHANNNPKQEILLKLSKCQECGKYDYSEMVQCDQCDKWSHYVCVGVSNEIQDIDWSCPRCSNIPIIASASRPSDAIDSVVANRVNPAVNPFVKSSRTQPPRTQKSVEMKMVKDGKSVKENFEKLEIEKEALKLENVHLKENLEKLEIEKEALKPENVHLRAFIEQSEDECKQQLDMLKKENEDLKLKNTNLNIKIEEKESELSNKENDEEVFPPLVESDSFTWPKVNYKTQYTNYDVELKKSGNLSDQFVKYINEKNYEEGLVEYIKLAAQLLFTKNFFLDRVSHKNETDRTNVKDTKIMKCLYESIKSKFEYDGNLCDKTRIVFKDFKGDVKRTPSLWNEDI